LLVNKNIISNVNILGKKEFRERNKQGIFSA